MSTCLIDGEFYPDITTKENVADQLRKIADQLDADGHSAFILYVGNYQVIVDWDSAEFTVLG